MTPPPEELLRESASSAVSSGDSRTGCTTARNVAHDASTTTLRVANRDAECHGTVEWAKTEQPSFAFQKAIERLAQCASVTGPDLYHEVVRALADALGTRWAFIGEIRPDCPEVVRTVAALTDGVLQEDVEYDLAGTPCEHVIQHRRTHYYSGDLKRRFPDDHLLHEMGAECYLGAPLRASDGSVIGVLNILHDEPLDQSLRPAALVELFAGRVAAALELERNFRALERSERDLADFFDNAAVGLHWVDRDGVITRANRAEFAMMGYEGHEREYIGQHIADFHADRHVIEDILARLSRGETLNDYPARLTRRDGSIRHVLITSNALFEDGKVVHTRCFTRDVTKQRAAEEQLRRSEEFNRRLIRSSSDCIKVLDLDGKLVSMSEGGQRLMAIRDISPFLNRPWTQWWADRSAVEEAVQAAREGGVGKFEGLCPAHDGTPRWWDVIITPILDHDGKPERLLAVSRDITQRRLTEKRLQESRQRLATLISNLPGMAYRCPTQPPWPLTFVSEGVRELTGYDAEDFIDQRVSWLDIMHPDDVAQVGSEIERAISERRIFSLVYRIRHKDGQTRWVLDRGQPIYDEKGKPVAFEGFVGDLTKQKQAEAAEQERAAELRTLLDTLPVGVFFAHDPECRRITGNPASDEMLRMRSQMNLSLTAPDEEKPKHFRVCRNGEELPPEELPVQRAARGEYIRNEEIETVFDDGTVTHQLISAAPLSDAKGQPRGSVASILDITERKRAEQALRRSESRYRTLVDVLPAGVYVCARDGTITAYNRRAVELWGREPKVGDSDERFCGALRLYRPDGRPLAHEETPMAACLVDGKAKRDLEVVIERPDGERFTVLVNISPLLDDKGNVVGAINCFQDISARKRDEQLLQQHLEQLRVLYDLTAEVGRAERLEDVYEAALDGLQVALGADRASILLFDDAGTMRFTAWRGLSDEYRAAVEGHSPWSPEEPDPQPIFIEDAEQADLGSLRNVVLGEGIRSLGFFPLLHHGRLLGKFMVYFDRPHSFSTDAIRLAQSIAGHISFAIDRQRASEAIRRREEEFRALAEHTPDVIARFDKHHRHLYLNPAIEAATGIKPDAFLGKTMHEVGLLADHCDRWERICREVFETQEPREMEFGFVHPASGEERHYTSLVVPELDPSGKVQSVLSVSRDITHRRFFEEQLREAEQRLRQLADVMPQIVWTCAADGSIEYMNGRWYEYSGIEQGRLDDQAWIDALHPEDRDRCVETVRRSNETGEPFEIEIRLRNGETGEYRWFLARRVPMLDEHGNVVRWFGTSTDIHDYKRAQEARSRLATIVESSEDAIVSKTLDGVIKSWNRGAERTFGYTAEEAVGQSITMIIPPDRLDEEDRILDRVRHGERVEPYEAIRMTKDGRPLDVWLTVSPIVDEGGRISGASTIVRDITDRKRAEAELRESEARQKLAMEAGNMGAWDWDIRNGTVKWSPMLEEIHGLAPGAFGGSFEDFARDIHPEDRERVLETVRRSVEARTPYQTEYRIVMPDGCPRWLEARGRVVCDEYNEPVRMTGVCMDVTARKRDAEELGRHRDELEQLVIERTAELESSYEQLRHAERMASLGTLSAGLGHDMGNLLLPMRLRLDSIERKILGGQRSEVKDQKSDLRHETLTSDLRPPMSEVQEDIKAIRQCAEYMQRLTNGLRLFALDPNEERAEEVTDLSQWWAEVEPFLKNALPKHVELERQFADDLPHVRIARHALTQAVFNLVQNAGDAMGSSNSVENDDDSAPLSVRVVVESDASDGCVRLSVIDAGPGMSAEVRRRCREPFFTTKPRGLSTGLGLALVHGIVQKARGRILIDSELGHGTTFTLVLPAITSSGASMAGDPGRADAGVVRGRAALDVRDARMRMFAASILRSLSFDVQDIGERREDGSSGQSVDLWVTDRPRSGNGSAQGRPTAGVRVVELDPSVGRPGCWRILRSAVQEIRRDCNGDSGK